MILRRQDSPAVGSVVVPPPPTPSQGSIISDNDCNGYQVSSVLSSVFGIIFNAVSLVQ